MWNFIEKRITDCTPIEVRQQLRWGGDDLPYPSPLSFSWEQLILSTARTTCLRYALPELSAEERAELSMSHALHLCLDLNLFLDPTTFEFLFSNKIEILDDEQRTSTSARTGAAIAGLVMENIGFYWSSNARELKIERPKSSADDTRKIPDFVYDPAGQFGFPEKAVVVVEAKGSLSKQRAKRSAVRRIAQEAYNGQVRHFVGLEADGLKIASGLAIAFGTVPASKASTLVIAGPQTLLEQASTPAKAFALSAASSGGMQMQPRPQPAYEVAEEEEVEEQVIEEEELEVESIDDGGGGGGPPGGGFRRDHERMPVNGRVALANYEAAFMLCGAKNCAAALRQILSGRSIDDLPPENLHEDFWIYESRDNAYLIGDRWIWQYAAFRYFGVLGASAEDVLRAISQSRVRPPETISLRPALPPAPEDAGLLAVQGDGFAAIKPEVPLFQRRWEIGRGAWAD